MDRLRPRPQTDRHGSRKPPHRAPPPRSGQAGEHSVSDRPGATVVTRRRLTGRHAHHLGVRDNKASYRLDQNTTLPRYLERAGYRTVLFGKWLNSRPLSDNPPHFEEFALLQPGYVDAQRNVNGTVRTISGYTTSIIKNRTLDFLDEAAADTRPWSRTSPRTPPTARAHPRRSTPERPSRTGTAGPPSRRATASTNRPTSGARPGPWPTGSGSVRNSCARCAPTTSPPAATAPCRARDR
ncbi:MULTISPECIES: sulfatase-like hydrolase/transferase [unclassified Streptomyces]|uniref:sulfatase-like hydrolase/transferase n=1 Tax=unclassified Streptomyces TaxID=2593676 RepID=UPI003320E832